MTRLQNNRRNSTTDHQQPNDVERHARLETNHAVYDVFRILKIVTEMIRDPKTVEILDIGRQRLLSSPIDLLNQLHTAVDSFISA
jgi:hypothetical protein